MQKIELWSNMTGSSEMDSNKQTEDSNNIPNNGKSESSDSIEVVTRSDINFHLNKTKMYIVYILCRM